MNKKSYINPAVTVFEIKANPLMDYSKGVGGEVPGTAGGPAAAKHHTNSLDEETDDFADDDI